ncbi:FAD-dependent oxidoreductase [Stieleria sp. ICT_E10.1]|uniref:FAD-dependent oxidoreductase n=1 Tax=Stieleria sedimenti TaxID=2976331 RepID=UPI00218019B8|nr:FAD-dependent oxidoreductase [Stieleria sedimenti]MCS7465738.1 FAD-dependent oxidoreductase [Stieleria sedimenti]
MKTKFLIALVLAILPRGLAVAAEPTTSDVVIYGGTSAAVTAAVQVKQMGKSVVLVCPDKHLGGLSSGGLGWTDTGKKEVIGGLARDFYHRIYLEYQKPEAWKWQSQDSYGNKGQGNRAIDGENRTQWIFEPHVAEKVFEDYVGEYNIPVHRDRWLDRQSGVEVVDGKIVSIRMLNGETYRAKVFLDATYEGDLLAAAGVPYHVGRESSAQYGENWNGVQTGVLHHQHHFGNLPPISPYQTPGDPGSGVLPRISADPPGEKGAADHRVQAYCFRMCLTDHPDNRVPFTKPDGYDPSQYELLARIYQAGWDQTFRKFDPIPNRKTDTNNHGPMSTDNIGFNYDYPDASYERRREIIREHETYQKGWLYFHVTDPRVPDEIRTKMQSWGLAADEFTDNGNWPHQIYVREARRMIGQYVMTENELQKRRATPKSVGMGSYSIDSHNVQRYITPQGHVQNEGDIGVSTGGPYQISYDSLVPRRSDCTNLLVPVCVSSSHIAFGSIRMEPVFMILGQSAATAAVLAIENGTDVQDVRYEALQDRLVADGQVLEYEGSDSGGAGLRPGDFSGVVLDNTSAKLDGSWQTSQANGPHFLTGYLHDSNTNKGNSRATFEIKLDAGTYDVQLAYPANKNRATNVPVQVTHADGSDSLTLNQRNKPAIEDAFRSLGRFRFDAAQPARVVIGNQLTDGYVIVDAVRFLPVKTGE